MGELSPELRRELRDLVADSVRAAMAEKIERTFGIDCTNVEERQETRKDMEFLRDLRGKARAGGERLFLIIVGVLGTGGLYYLISWLWPDGFDKYFKH